MADVPGTPEEDERWSGDRVELVVRSQVGLARLLTQVAAVAAVGLVVFAVITSLQVFLMVPDVKPEEALALAQWPMMLQGAGVVLVLTAFAAIPWLAINLRGARIAIASGPGELTIDAVKLDVGDLAEIRWGNGALELRRNDGTVVTSEPIRPRDGDRLAKVLGRAIGL